MFGWLSPSGSGSKMVCGLGNPGSSYANTRHNVGFQVVSRLSRSVGGSWTRYRKLAQYSEVELEQFPVVLVQPLTFMNLSGQGVVPLMRKFKVKPEDLLVIHDDLDLSFGGIRLRPGGSAGGHRGVQSIIDQLQTRNFPRLRVGIDRPPEGEDAAEYVLHPFPWDNRETLDEMLELAVAAVRVWVAEGIETAMNRSNKRRSQKSDPQDCGIPDR